MGFAKNVKYGAVTLDFVAECARKLGKDLSKNETLLEVLYLLGFEVSVFNEHTGKYIRCKIQRSDNVIVRNKDKPYLCRKATVLSGRLRGEKDFPSVSVYERVAILDVSSDQTSNNFLVQDLDYDIPTIEKVNTRKYTKKSDRGQEITMGTSEQAGEVAE